MLVASKQCLPCRGKPDVFRAGTARRDVRVYGHTTTAMHDRPLDRPTPNIPALVTRLWQFSGGAHRTVPVHALLQRHIHAIVRAAVLAKRVEGGHRFRQRSVTKKAISMPSVVVRARRILRSEVPCVFFFWRQPLDHSQYWREAQTFHE